MMKFSIFAIISIVLICLVHGEVFHSIKDKSPPNTEYDAKNDKHNVLEAVLDETSSRIGQLKQPHSVKQNKKPVLKYDSATKHPKEGKLTTTKTERMVVPLKGSVKLDMHPSAKYYIYGYSNVYGGYTYYYKGYIVRATIVASRGYCSFGSTIFAVGRYIVVYSSCYYARLYMIINV